MSRTPSPQPSPSPPSSNSSSSSSSSGSAVFSEDEEQTAPRQGRSNRRARSPSYSSTSVSPPPLEQQTPKRTRREPDPNEAGPSRAQQPNADGRRTPLQARRQSLPPGRPQPNRGQLQQRIERPTPPAARRRRNRRVPETVASLERPQRARRQPDRFDPVPAMRPQGVQRRAQIRLAAPNQQLNMIPRAPMQRLIHEIADGLGPDAYRFQATSLEALRMSSEARMVELMEDANMCALHAKRVTIKIKDIQLAQLFYIKYNRV